MTFGASVASICALVLGKRQLMANFFDRKSISGTVFAARAAWKRAALTIFANTVSHSLT